MLELDIVLLHDFITTDPNPPSSLTVTGITASGFNVSWTAPTGRFDSFRYYINANAPVVISTLSVPILGLTAGTLYSVTVLSSADGALSSPVSLQVITSKFRMLVK